MKSSHAPETEALRRPVSLGNEVYEALYAQLMSLKIPPGSRISVDNLVRTLGVSQTPIREALTRLETQGLVVKTHLIGYSAAEQMSRKNFEELYDMRLLLEPFAAARVASKRDDRIMAELKQLDSEMEAQHSLESRSAYGEFAKRDASFHNLIAKSCDNNLIYEALSRLHTHVHLFRLYFHSRATTDANHEHKEIISAIEEGNSERAEEAMRNHILRSQSRFQDAFAEH